MKNVLVLDGFYTKPEAVREFALNCEWIDRSTLNPEFPGTESRKCFYSPSLVDKLSKLIGCKVQPEPQRSSFGAFALGLDSDRAKRVIHVDACDWTGIVYLALDRNSQGGTTLFQHKRTGLRSRPTISDLKRLGYPDMDAFELDVLKQDGRDFTAWEPDVQIDMRFNRLLLFRGGHLFHAPDQYFGTSTENGRLVQLFFFRELGD
jgi:Family of unknown function (DUF6445)